MGFGAACPRPQIDASTIACDSSLSSGWSQRRPSIRVSALAVPTRQGVHCPQDSSEKNFITLRAAAVSESRPSRILGLLNDAIRRQTPDQSCTVACGRLDVDGANGARVTLSVGGHPLPLVLRADGQVEPVGEPGTMLGVLPDPQLADQTADLAPGDALVLYTDGLTDAYAPGRLVKRAGLVAALESCAGRSATEIASGIQEAVLGVHQDEPRDDIVLLVLRIPERRAGAHPR